MSEERYNFPGTPLTPRQNETLTILIEECSEVIKAATKLQRFGKEHYPGYGDNNQQLGLEIGDLSEMIEITGGEQLFSVVDVTAGRKRKREQLKKFMRHI